MFSKPLWCSPSTWRRPSCSRCLLTSLFQSVTSVQEPTLTFAPKLLTFAGLSLLLAPWLLRMMGEFAISMFARMATLAH